MSLALLARTGSAVSTPRLVTVISCTEANQVKTNSLPKIQYSLFCRNKWQRRHKRTCWRHGCQATQSLFGYSNSSGGTSHTLGDILAAKDTKSALFLVLFNINKRIQNLMSTNPRSLSSMVRSLISMPDNRMAAIVPGSSSLVTSMSFSNDSAALLNAFNIKTLWQHVISSKHCKNGIWMLRHRTYNHAHMTHQAKLETFFLIEVEEYKPEEWGSQNKRARLQK